jgi:CRP-like cAMP-binding protein
MSGVRKSPVTRCKHLEAPRWRRLRLFQLLSVAYQGLSQWSVPNLSDRVPIVIAEEMTKNRVLAGLPSQERDLVLPSCAMVDVHLGDHIDEVGQPIRFLYFPLDAAISMTATEQHVNLVEVTLTGKEGASGSSLVLGDDRSTCTAMIQIPGTAIRVPASVLKEHLPRLPYLGAALARHTLLLMGNAVISVGCSTYHDVPQRLARWLKAHSHRAGIDSFPFSSQFLAVQVGCDPKSIEEALDDFQRQSIVKQKHNNVTITDHEALGKRACECYERAKQATEQYLLALQEIARRHGTA